METGTSPIAVVLTGAVACNERINLSEKLNQKGSMNDAPETVEIEIEYTLVVQLAQRTMQLLSTEQRLTFIEDIAKGYCRHCGDPHPKDGICQCWNDE